MAYNSSQVVKFKCDPSDSMKSAILDLCVRNDIKVEKILSRAFGYIVIFPTAADADRIFVDKILTLFAASDAEPVLPNALRANRSIVLKKVDQTILDLSHSQLVSEISSKNSWCVVKEVIKFPNSPGMKVTFATSAMADRACSSGLFILRLFISKCKIARDIYVHIPTCYRCYKIDSHQSHHCPEKSDFSVCSLCSSCDHTWKDCQSDTKKCLNCGGPHASLSMQCDLRKRFIKSARSPLHKPAVFSSQSAKSSEQSVPVHDLTRGSDVIAKTASCILLTLLSGYSTKRAFCNQVNKLFTDNNLPSLNLDRYTPPDDSFLNKLFSEISGFNRVFTGEASSIPTSNASTRTSSLSARFPTEDANESIYVDRKNLCDNNEPDSGAVWGVSLSGAWNNTSSLVESPRADLRETPLSIPGSSVRNRQTPETKSLTSPKEKNKPNSNIPRNLTNNRNQPSRSAKLVKSSQMNGKSVAGHSK